jgi:NitT/TauT family transport system permease protein
MKLLLAFASRLIIAAAFLIVWWAVDLYHPLPNYLFPTPKEFLLAFLEPSLQHAFWESAVASLAGLFLSSFVGFLLASAIHQLQWLYKILYPIAIFFQVVPIVAIAPLLIIWFGYGLPSVVASSVIVGFFPILVNSFAGFRSIPEEHYFLFFMNNATRWTKFIKLEIPSALPYLGNGIRIASGSCVIGCVVGEFVSGGGLGGVISASRQEMNLGLCYAAIVASTILGYTLFESTRLIPSVSDS